MYELKVVTRFAAAHRLTMVGTKCENLHGHNWKIEVFPTGEKLDEAGVVMDFGDIKIRLGEIIGRLDHQVSMRSPCSRVGSRPPNASPPISLPSFSRPSKTPPSASAGSAPGNPRTPAPRISSNKPSPPQAAGMVYLLKIFAIFNAASCGELDPDRIKRLLAAA